MGQGLNALNTVRRVFISLGRVPFIPNPHVIGINRAFVFDPLRPLGDLAGAHDEPAEQALWDDEHLRKQLNQRPTIEVQRQPLPAESPGLTLLVDARAA
jgi:hypothetical protein